MTLIEVQTGWIWGFVIFTLLFYFWIEIMENSDIVDRGTLISPIINILNFIPGYRLWGPVIATSLIYLLMANILVFLFFTIDQFHNL